MLMRPFFIHLDFKTGDLSPHDRTNTRKLSDMKGMFLNTREELRILEKDDPVIYSFSEKILPEENGHLQLATTSIHPGKIGDEYFMTKGHYHRRPDTSEAYLGLKGPGSSRSLWKERVSPFRSIILAGKKDEARS